MSDTKPVRDSQVVIGQMMLPTDANPVGYVHGGAIMKLADTTAAVAAMRHSRMRVTTARIDSLSFLAPIRVGDLVTLRASVNYVGRTSMEVGVRVEAEDLRNGNIAHVASAYFVFVALDEHNHPCPVPQLIVETDTERRRMDEAKLRRRVRTREAEIIQFYRHQPLSGTWARMSNGKRLSIVGHRGAMGHAPENTMVSFARGVEMGADMIEFDVHLSKDNQIIVIHDPTVNRTTNGQGFVKDMTLAELKQLDAGTSFTPQYAGQRIPTLNEVLEWARGKTKVAIEIKNGPVYYLGIEERVIETLKRYAMVDDTIVISFDHQSVKRAKELEPNLTTGVLFAARPIDVVSLAAAANADVLLPHWAYVTPDVLAEAHNANLAISTWEIHEIPELEYVARLGVDAIGTNHPDRLKAVLERITPDIPPA